MLITNTLDASNEVQRLIALARHIASHADETLTLEEMAKGCGMSASCLQRRFTAVIGLSPKRFQDALRLNRFRAALRDGDSVTGAIYESGYGSTSRLYEKIERHLGMTPSAIRAGGAGEDIAYALQETVQGPMIMGATLRGVCCVHFADDADSLIAALKREFPGARFRPADPDREALGLWMDLLDSHLAAGGPLPDLPLDIRGTAFQRKAWDILTALRPGETMTYGGLAARMGRPKAVRAAAGACAANRHAVVIPCHRVLRGDGGLGGYRWGVARKRRLLAHESS